MANPIMMPPSMAYEKTLWNESPKLVGPPLAGAPSPVKAAGSSPGTAQAPTLHDPFAC